MSGKKNFLYRSFTNNPIRKSLSHLYAGVFLVPFLIISVIFVSILYSTLKKWEVQRVRSSLINAESSMNEMLGTVKGFSDRIYVNRVIQETIFTEYETGLDAYLAYTNLGFLNDYLQSFREVSSFRIYSENQTLLDNSFIIKTTPQIKKESWYEKAVQNKSKVFWMYKTDSITKNKHLALIRSIYSLQDKSFVGVLVINVDPDQIVRTLKNQFYEAAIAYENQIVFSSDENLSREESQVLMDVIGNPKNKKNDLFPVQWKGHKSVVLARKFSSEAYPVPDFTLLYVIPMRELNKVTAHVIVPTLLIIIVVIILSFLSIKLFGNYINLRVRIVRDQIQNVVDNNFSIPDTIGGTDEFEQIYHSVFLMSEKVSNLINQVYKHQLDQEQIASRQNEIRYKMLATQINPHFLFNTLETIRMKSLASGDKEVSTMLKLLASLLRYNLNVSGKAVPLFKELEAIQNYLNIQRYRFGQRISYDIITMCDVQKITILPLLIQPLVENSFSHGLEGKISGGFIYILISEEAVQDGPKLLTISVKDNGCGISEEKLKELNKAMEMQAAEYESSIGLMNVNSRIKLYYGDKYGVKIESEEGKGTEVKISFPLIGTELLGNSRI